MSITDENEVAGVLDALKYLDGPVLQKLQEPDVKISIDTELQKLQKHPRDTHWDELNNRLVEIRTENMQRGEAKMTKKDLIEAISDYPDDAPVVAVGGLHSLISHGILKGYDENSAVVFAVSGHPDVIALEL